MLNLTAFVTVLAVLVYFWTSFRVAGARRRFGVALPAISGNLDFERVFRGQMNTLEWMPIFLPVLWLAAYYFSDRWAALVGLVWVLARVAYAIGYAQKVELRGPGFLVQAICCIVLLVLALVGLLPKLAGSL